MTFIHPERNGFPATFFPEPLQCPRGDPPLPVPEPFHPGLQSTSHFHLKAARDALPEPNKGPVLVSIVDGSKGKTVRMTLDRSATVAELKQKFLQQMPDLQWLSLSCNGKPVQEHDVLKDLRLGEKVTFVTFQRCHGG
uniref:Ubiquitin-like domain-containing protein n=2 Tax=Scleropages formosus TaxID=113540 RepID=A0A8C9RKV7_SCLFO